jgi:hypothetical protein
MNSKLRLNSYNLFFFSFDAKILIQFKNSHLRTGTAYHLKADVRILIKFSLFQNKNFRIKNFKKGNKFIKQLFRMTSTISIHKFTTIILVLAHLFLSFFNKVKILS